MKAAIFLATATLVLAQDIAKYVPSCSLKCLQDAMTSATKCQPLDGKCICDRPNFEAIYNSGTACVLQACGSDTSLTQVLPGTYKYCEDVLAGASSSSVVAPTGTPSPRPTDVPIPSDVSILPVTPTGGNSTITTASPTTPSSSGTTSRGTGTMSAPAGGGAAGGASAGAGLVAALGAGLAVLL
ncbi:hypothetical protein RB595_002017 [Gaeumannomyces hyphopodioides]